MVFLGKAVAGGRGVDGAEGVIAANESARRIDLRTAAMTARRAARCGARAIRDLPIVGAVGVSRGTRQPRAYSGQVPTLLHISDLHRTPGPRLNNGVILAAMASDARRWEEEGIPHPDLVVVSGDLIQGASLDSTDPDSEITAQYAEARDFLYGLAAQFTGCDRSRIILVPGNHDVHWNRARNAMRELTDCPTPISQLSLQSDSGVRWSWAEQKAYEISDWDLYRSRYEHYRLFREEFYAGVEPNPIKHADCDLISVEYPDDGLIVVGFASWYGHDCYCRVGDIDPAALVQSQQLLAHSTAPVAAAVWHHSIVGGPRVHDYMDPHVVHKLIDYGFSVGLHGHQHHSGAAPYELHLPNLTSMAIVGAGSLAVGDDQLPAGELRQYNLVSIDNDRHCITVHVRAMSPAGVFYGSHRDDFGGNSFVRLDLPRRSRSMRQLNIGQLRDEAIACVNQGQFEKALQLLDWPKRSATHHIDRQIVVVALEGLDRRDPLLAFLDPSHSAEEAIKLVSLHIDARQFDEALECLSRAAVLLDEATVQGIGERIEVERMMA